MLDVFRSSAERQGAYDFLANDGVKPEAMLEAMRAAAVERAGDYRECIVSIDGTSLKLKDWKKKKDPPGTTFSIRENSGAPEMCGIVSRGMRDRGWDGDPSSSAR